MERHQAGVRRNATRERMAIPGDCTFRCAIAPGMIAGAIIGAFAGIISGSVIDGDARRETAHTRELDEELGVEPLAGEKPAHGPMQPPVARC